MRKLYHTILKKHFRKALIHTREQKALTQFNMAQLLCMDERSYLDLEHGKTCCSAVTMALFLLYVCDDLNGFLEALRLEMESACAEAA